ncbi:MAG TPA: hypothetical protein VF982_00315 [Anaerolineales bacterium]
MTPGGSLLLNSSSMRIPIITRYGRMLNYLNTNTVTGGWVQNSGCAFDPGDGSVWSVNDTPGQAAAYNYTLGGARLKTIAGSVISPTITELEGVTVSPRDYTLWFVDDTPGYGGRLWHCDRSGAPLQAAIDLTPYGVTSAQDVEYDRSNDTLLVICNGSKKVYRLDLSGALIGSTDLSGITPQPFSWQSVTIDLDNGGWWLSGYSPNVLILVDPLTLNVVTQVAVSASDFPSGVMGALAGIAYNSRFDKQ